MPEVIEVQLIDPRTFAVTTGGTTDTYRGMKRVNYSVAGARVIPRLLEGEMSPSAYHQIPNTAAAITGTVSGDSHAVEALAGTQVDQFEVTAFELGTSNTITKRFTGVTFEQFDNGIDRASLAGNSIRFNAVSVATI